MLYGAKKDIALKSLKKNLVRSEISDFFNGSEFQPFKNIESNGAIIDAFAFHVMRKDKVSLFSNKSKFLRGIDHETILNAMVESKILNSTSRTRYTDTRSYEEVTFTMTESQKDQFMRDETVVANISEALLERFGRAGCRFIQLAQTGFWSVDDTSKELKVITDMIDSNALVAKEMNATKKGQIFFQFSPSFYTKLISAVSDNLYDHAYLTQPRNQVLKSLCDDYSRPEIVVQSREDIVTRQGRKGLGMSADKRKLTGTTAFVYSGRPEVKSASSIKLFHADQKVEKENQKAIANTNNLHEKWRDIAVANAKILAEESIKNEELRLKSLRHEAELEIERERRALERQRENQLFNPVYGNQMSHKDLDDRIKNILKQYK